jgi:hypothetical protein
MEDRRSFIKKVGCMTGACLCGFTGMLQTAEAAENATTGNPNEKLMQDWISNLLAGLSQTADESTHRTILKACAESHYRHLNMDALLEPYIGKIDAFNRYIEQEWGWKVDYNRELGRILADENKSACVCPMVDKAKGVKSSILCYCSEGFAERMFSKVVGHPVKAQIVQSIHRGATSCIYRIDL